MSQNYTKPNLFVRIKGIGFERNCGGASVGVLQDNLVLSTGLITRIGHRKEIQKLAFRALALRQSESSYADVLRLVTRDKPKNVCVGGFAPAKG